MPINIDNTYRISRNIDQEEQMRYLMRDLKAAGLPVREDITTADEAVAEILRALNQRIE